MSEPIGGNTKRVPLIPVFCLALLLTACAPTKPVITEDCTGIHCQVQDVEDLAGFSVLVPEFVPSYFVFDVARYDPGSRSVVLSYSHRDAPREYLWISQRLAESATISQLGDTYPADAIRNVMVGSGPAEFIQGVYSGGEFDPSISNQQLAWQVGGIEFSIASTLPSATAEETLIRIAESMR